MVNLTDHKTTREMLKFLKARGAKGLLLTFAGVGVVAASHDLAVAEEALTPVAHIVADVFTKVAEPSPPGPYGQMTWLESPAFGKDGKLYFVDMFPASGEPKIARLDLDTKKVEGLYTDKDSAFSSVKFSPHDGNMYICDYITGAVYRFDLEERKLEKTFDGVVEGYRIKTDDIAFDQDGFMYLSDNNGTLDKPSGKLVRLDQEGRNPAILYEGLAGGNGIAFAPDYTNMWISESKRSVINGVWLSNNGKSVSVIRVGMHVESGTSYADSLSVDSAGNLYQSLGDAGRVMIYSKHGDLVGIVTLKDGLPKPQLLTTNVAIKPNSTDAYITVGGENGGYIYHFKALAPGGTQSNGG